MNDSDDIFHDANARGTVRISTRAIIGLGFTVAATLAVTACQSGGARSSGGESTPSATVASDPRQALQGGVAAVSRSTFRLHFTTPSADVTGSIDPAGEKGDLTAVATMLNGRKGTSEVRQLGRDYWIKLDLGGAPQPNPWMHVDPAKVKRPDQMYFADHNVTGTETLMHNLVTVTRSGGQYTGTVDLSQSITKTSTSNLRYFELDTNRTTALGATAKSLPFSATLDERGRLTRIEVDVPAAGTTGAYSAVMEYSDFGVPVSPARPDNAIDATEYVYLSLNGS